MLVLTQSSRIERAGMCGDLEVHFSSCPVLLGTHLGLSHWVKAFKRKVFCERPKINALKEAYLANW